METSTPKSTVPVQDLLAALHVEPEVREGHRGGVGVSGQQVPRPLVVHLLPLFPLLPPPLALLVPAATAEGKRRR